MKHRARIIGILCSILFLFTFEAHASLFSVSDAEVISAGRQAHNQIMKQYGAWNNPIEKERVERLGKNLAKFSARPDIHYRFYLVNQNVLNAFATPDGSIHVTRALVSNFPDDNELSFVLGHEITHVEKRHGKQQVEKMMETQMAGNALLLILGGGSATRFGLNGAAYWLSMKYSRDFEYQADEGGMQLLSRAGIDPQNGPKALQHLFNLDKSNPGMMEKYFGTHPMPADRITKAQEVADSLKRRSQAFRKSFAEGHKSRTEQFVQSGVRALHT